jgi:cobalt-zinc-cadmium efflux system membrane fusion protein
VKMAKVFLSTVLMALLLSACGQSPNDHADEHGHAHAGEEGHASDAHGHDAEDIPRGPHNGRLFEQNGFGLEVTIFEEGVEPEFRVYPTMSDKPVDPSTVQLTMTLERLGATQTIRFVAKDGYLRGDQVVYEPHSFSVKLSAGHQKKEYAFQYDQIEWRVELSPEQVTAAGLEILKAGPAGLADEVELQGEIRVAPNSEAVVLAPVSGVVVSAPASLGQSVKAGEVLATLESRELADFKRAYLEARERAWLAESTFQREAMLWKEKITAEQDYLIAKSAKAEADINVASSRAALLAFGLTEGELKSLRLEQPGNLARLVVRAPRNGRVTARDLAPGQRISPDSALFTISDLDRLVAVLSASPAQLDGLQPGQAVTVSMVNGDVTGNGRVQVVSPLLDESNRAASIFVAMDNPALWRPGQFVKAKVTRATAPAAVTVSVDALQSFRDWTVVFARYGNQFEVRPVTVGRRSSRVVEILDGLSAGQDYVGKNSFVLKADIGKSEASHEH